MNWIALKNVKGWLAIGMTIAVTGAAWQWHENELLKQEHRLQARPNLEAPITTTTDRYGNLISSKPAAMTTTREIVKIIEPTDPEIMQRLSRHVQELEAKLKNQGMVGELDATEQFRGQLGDSELQVDGSVIRRTGDRDTDAGIFQIPGSPDSLFYTARHRMTVSITKEKDGKRLNFTDENKNMKTDAMEVFIQDDGKESGKGILKDAGLIAVGLALLKILF
jgi:hypothetical protein